MNFSPTLRHHSAYVTWNNNTRSEIRDLFLNVSFSFHEIIIFFNADIVQQVKHICRIIETHVLIF